MKKFYFTAALSFIILLCLEDAQGQYLSRSNLRQFQRRKRTRADRNHQQHPHTQQQQLQQATSPQQPKSNNDVVVNQVSDLAPGKYEMLAILADSSQSSKKYSDERETVQESRPSLSFVRPPGSIYDSEALLVISEGETDRVDPGNWFKIDSVYPLFPPGTKPFEQNRPRRQHQQHRQPPRALSYTPYTNPYSGQQPDYTKPPYVAPKRPYQVVPESYVRDARTPAPERPFSFPTPAPTRPYLQPVTPQYQEPPPPSYDDHLPYQLHPERGYAPEEHDLVPQPYTPKPYLPHEHVTKAYQHFPVVPDHSPRPHGHVPKKYAPTPAPNPHAHSVKPYVDAAPENYGPEPYHPAHRYPHHPAPTTPKTYVQHYGHLPTTPGYQEPYKKYTHQTSAKKYSFRTTAKPQYNKPEPEYSEQPTPRPLPPKPLVEPYEPVHSRPYSPNVTPVPVPINDHYQPTIKPRPYTPAPNNYSPKPSGPTHHPKSYSPSPYTPVPKILEPYTTKPTHGHYKPTPKPKAYTPVPKHYSPEPPIPIHPPSPTTPATHYKPTPYTPAPKQYSPGPTHPPTPTQPPKLYKPTPEPYEPEPYQPYKPTPEPYEPEPYQPTPKPYTPVPKQYSPIPPIPTHPPKQNHAPKPYKPTPQPYTPERYQPYKPAPQPYKPEPEPYQPYKPEPEPSYYDDKKYKHFPVVDTLDTLVTHPPKAHKPRPKPEQYAPESNYRLPKKQEFSNFPYNPYNEFAEQSLDPVRVPDKRKIVSGGSSALDNLQNFVTPRSKSKQSKKKNKQRKPIDPLDKLKAFAGFEQNGAEGDLISNEKPFVCPTSNGHFGDPNDCTKFYKCAHGTPIAEFCPATLFWNQANEQCDWPEQTLCQFDAGAVKAKLLPEKTYLYLTFDDGPNEGTSFVLDALATYNAPATFFINSDNMYDPKTAKAEASQRSLLKIVDGGHVLADHSFDHMNHNSNDSPRNAYTNVEQDMQYFGSMNAEPVMDLLWSNGRRDSMNFVNHTLNSYVRMPYTNNWRIPSMRVHHDCSRCTIPASSGQRGIEISNRLASHGKRIIGWDDEWGVEWTQNSLKYGGAAAYQKLNRRHTKMPQKIVLLMHDIAFRTPEASEELRTFVRLANESGYIFSTIDQYETDNL